MSISPLGAELAVVYSSGKLAIYSIPNLINSNRCWELTEQVINPEILKFRNIFIVKFQPYYNEIDSEISENPNTMKQFKKIYSPIDYKISDIGWWSEKVVH